MNQDSEKRMLLIFVFAFALMIASTFMFKPQTNSQIPANQPAAETNTSKSAAAPQASATTASNIPIDEATYTIKKDISFNQSTSAKGISLNNNNELMLVIDPVGGRITNILLNGKWNRLKKPVPLLSEDITYKPGDTFFGNLEYQSLIKDRPAYSVKEASSNSVTLVSSFRSKGSSFEITKKYNLTTDYQFTQEISIRNLSRAPAKIDLNGKSLSIAASFSFFTKEQANSGNLILDEYYDGKDLKKALQSAFFQARDKVTTAANPKWLVSADNYFMAVMKPEFEGSLGKFILVKEDKSFSESVIGLELPPLFLEGGESKSFKISYYIGPKKEGNLTKIDRSYGKIFAWPAAFNWFMKPFEIALTFLMDFLSKFIGNWGLIIIILAILIKVILSPLSIKAAVSIKRSNLLQPKIKQLQEKYKDDPKTLNEKIGELYKKEKVNPLGGCFPILLQLPVFFALYRVLSTSVELKGATFLWIKDLTQPDMLFTISIPFLQFLPTQFNLLPIIMTVVQVIQMKLQSMKSTGNTQQNAMNTYLLPVVFLFLFWGMPSGLVLYWTIQNLWSIGEQEVINKDKQVKLI